MASVPSSFERSVRAMTLLWVIGARAAFGQALPLGTEFQVNMSSAGVQSQPAIAADPSGNFIVVWSDQPSTSVRMRRFDDAGMPAGTEGSVAGLPGLDAQPSIATHPTSGSLVAWSRGGGMDGDGAAVFARHFLSDGSPAGAEFQANTLTTGDQVFPDVIAGTTGFLITWDNPADGTITGQRFDPSVTPLGTQFQINTYTSGGAAYGANAAMDPNGNFIVVWNHSEQDGDAAGVFGQRFDSAGAPAGTEFQVNSFTPGYQYEATVASDTAGNFVVAWTSYYTEPYSYSYQLDLRARRYASSGAPLGSEFVVSKGDGQYFGYPDVVSDPHDGFVVTWTDGCGGYCYSDVYAQRYSAGGAAIGARVRLHEETELSQRQSRLAMDAEGDFVAVWIHDRDEFVTNYDLFARQFATTSNTPICTNGTIAEKALTKLAKLKLPTGDEKMVFKGRLAFAPDQLGIFAPNTDGAQILIEDLGNGNNVLFELSYRTVAIPGGAGCGPGDGWTVNGAGNTFKYTNESDALPPGCAPGSANGLRSIKLKDRRAQKGFVGFTIKVKGAALPASITGPLRSTLVVGGAAATASAAGECGAQTAAAAACGTSPNTIKCR